MDNVAQLNVAALAAQKIYHSEDNISELCIRVRLRPCQTQGIVGQSSSGGSDIMASSSSGAALLGDPGTGSSPTVVGEEMEEFRWAQRVLGFHEPPGPSEVRQGRRLFARYHPAGTKLVENEGGLTPLLEAHDEASIRRCSCTRLSKMCGFLGASCHRSRKSVASRAIAENTREENLAFYDRMQIFAVLDVVPESGSDLVQSSPTRIEVLLCDLRAQDAGKVLVVQPPFVKSSSGAGELSANRDDGFAYEFELLDGKSYEYAIENASYVPTEDERRRAAEAQHGFEAAAPQLRRNLAGTGFDSHGNSFMQMAIVGEIVSFDPNARGRATTIDNRDKKHGSASSTSWEAEAIMRRTTPVPLHGIIWRPSFYVVYELSLPGTGEWDVLGGNLPTGTSMCTQFTSLSGCATHKDRCVFNQPLEVHLSYNPRSQATLDGPPLDPLPPRLVFQVLQVGSWDRHTLHGYSFVDMPKLPGEYDVHVPLWSPMGTISQQLNAKLCGAFMPLASPHLVAVADAHQRDALPRNRSALRAQTAVGMLHVQLKVMRRQHKSTLAQGQSVDVPGATLAIEGAASMPAGEQLEGLRRRRAARAQKKAEAAQVATTAGALLANVQHQPLRW